jgi:DNA-binding transcriptional ArsR family regulator
MSKATERAVTDAAALFFALGAGTRLTIVKRLGEGEPLSATALGDGARVSRQAIVKHLRVLEEAGIVSHAPQGREVLYTLEARRVDEAREFLAGISAGWDRAVARLRALVEGKPGR